MRIGGEGPSPPKTPKRQEKAAPKKDRRTIEKNICDESSGGKLIQMIRSVEWEKNSPSKPIEKNYPRKIPMHSSFR